MKISIITNSFKRKVSLVERSLTHSLKLTNEYVKVTFIDQNKESLKLKKEITAHEHFLYSRASTTCVSEARNSASIPPDTEWIIFCDDDGYIDGDYIVLLESITKANPSLEIIAGSIIRDDTMDFYTPRHRIGGSLKSFRNSKLLMGSNFAVKYDTFKKLGGFDPNFGAGGYWGSGEETDFSWNAFFKKIPMEYFPELKVYHVKPHALGLLDNIKKSYKYGLGKGALVCKWLIFKKKPVVFIELIEMTFVPFILSITSILKLRPQDTLIYFSALIGRYTGLVKALSRKNKMEI